jgi:hypothetical protein
MPTPTRGPARPSAFSQHSRQDEHCSSTASQTRQPTGVCSTPGSIPRASPSHDGNTNAGCPFEQLAFSRLDAYRLGTTTPLPDGWNGIGTEVLLRLLDTTHALDLPDALVPTLLPLATHDWLRQVQPYAADDTRSMREWSRTLTRERVQEYMLTLVTARLLVRPARTGGRH